MQNNLFRLGLLVPLLTSLVLPLQANAEMEFAGFASLVYAKTLDDDEGPLVGANSDVGNEGEYRDFNKLGLRMDAELRDRVDFATQVIAYGYDDYDPEFDWAYFAFHITSELRLDVGRIRMPTYRYSDYIDVGYAYQWVNPPYSVYQRAFVQSMEGVKLSYFTDIGDWSSELLVYGGATNDKLDVEGEKYELEVDNLYGISWAVDNDWITLKAIHSNSSLSFEHPGINALLAGIQGMQGGINAIVAGINAANPGANIPLLNTTAVVKEIEVDKDGSQYSGLSATFDFGKIFTIMELTHAEYDDNLVIHETDAYFLTVGGRLPGKVTVSLTAGELNGKVNEDIMQSYETAFAPYLGPTGYLGGAMDVAVAGLQQAVEGTVRSVQDKDVAEYALSVRWDFHPSAAFKFEYLMQEVEGISQATLEEIEREPTAYRIGLDLVF